MAEPNRRSNPKQVFDVAKPNKSRPSNTAKPVIVTNRPILQDPMVNPVSSSGEPTTAPPLSIKLPTKIHIEPLSSSAELANVSEPIAVKNLAADAPPLDATSPISEHLAKARAEAAENSKLEENSELSENSEPEAVSEPEISPAADAVIAVEDPKLVAPTDLPAKTTTENRLQIRHGAPQRRPERRCSGHPKKTWPTRKTKTMNTLKTFRSWLPKSVIFCQSIPKKSAAPCIFIILGVVLILLLAAAWADIALDAGLIHLDGVRPLTHLFSN